MLKIATLAALVLAVATPAGDHGGKVKWTEPKSAKEFDALIAQANASGRAGMIFFTMDG